MSHERSETVQRGGKWYNVYGKGTPKAGQVLPGEPEYNTVEEAVAAAKARSESTNWWEEDKVEGAPVVAAASANWWDDDKIDDVSHGKVEIPDLPEPPSNARRAFDFAKKYGPQVPFAGPEAALALGTSMVAAPVSGLAGILGSFLPGGEGQGADWTRKTQNALTYTPRTEAGQNVLGAVAYPFEKFGEFSHEAGGRTTDLTGSPAAGTAVNTLIQSVPMLAGARMGAKSAATRQTAAEAAAARLAAEAETRAKALPGFDQLSPEVRGRVLEIAKDPEAWPAFSQEIERRLQGRGHGVPVPMTKGQASRDPTRLRAEENVAQTPQGRPIYDMKMDQDAALVKNLDLLRDLTGSQSAGKRAAVGEAVAGETGALTMAERASLENVDKLYTKAWEAGAKKAEVDFNPLLAYITSHENPSYVSFALNKLKQLKAVASNEAGNFFKERNLTLNELEGVRKAAGVIVRTSSDGTARHYAREVIGKIDEVTDKADLSKVGEKAAAAYKEARQARFEHGNKFEEQQSVARLLDDKTRTDRRVALEDVWDRTVRQGSIQDLRNVQNVLLETKDRGLQASGKQAWRELAGETIQHLRNEATKGVPPNARGEPVFNAGNFKKALDDIGPEKLELLFGKSTAMELQKLSETAVNIKTHPPFTQGSTTVPNALSLLNKIWWKLGHTPFIGTTVRAGIAGAKQAAEWVKSSKTIEEAIIDPLGPVPNAMAPKPGNRNALSRAAGAAAGMIDDAAVTAGSTQNERRP